MLEILGLTWLLALTTSPAVVTFPLGLGPIEVRSFLIGWAGGGTLVAIAFWASAGRKARK